MIKLFKTSFILFIFLLLQFSCIGDARKKHNLTNRKGEKIGKWYYLNEADDTVKLEYYDSSSILKREVLFTKKKPRIEKFFMDGEMSKNVIWYDNGAIKSVSNYLDGKKHGLEITYYANGTTETEVNYSKGLPSGFFRQYYSNGILNVSSENVGNGITNFYDSSGNLATVVLFTDFKAVDTLNSPGM